MIATVHLISGAVIAKKIKNPYLAWISAFFSHFFLDAIFHAEYSGHHYWFILLIFDLLIGIIAVWWLVRKEKKKDKIRIWIGAILANVPDMLSFGYRLFLPLISSIPILGSIFSFLLTKFFDFHFWTHASAPPSFILGLLTQILVITISFIWYQKNTST